MVNLHYLGIQGGDEFKAQKAQDAAFHTLSPYIRYLRAFEDRLKATAPSIHIEPAQRDEPGNVVRLILPEDESPAATRLRTQFLEAWEVTDDEPSNRPKPIRVEESDDDEALLRLDRKPKGNTLWLRPNTTAIWRALQAINRLMEQPGQDATPLLRLVQDSKFVAWPRVEPASIDEWAMLDDGYPGVEQQRAFVQIALGTPDFAFLEGPPGSGKTQAICELIVQAARRGQRVLLAASTHVAVDNVLEKLADEGILDKDVIGVRIGREASVSEAVQHHMLGSVVKEFRRKSAEAIDRQADPSPAQREFRAVLRDGTRGDAVEQLVLSSVNLVCGTTIGILQHPGIRAGHPSGAEFDLLIIDEASKTTFAEFLVPALHARRWVLVGDIQQLSPFVDPEEVAASVQGLVSDACFYAIEASIAALNPRQPGPIIVPALDDAAAELIEKECVERGLFIGKASDAAAVWTADVIMCTPEEVVATLDSGPPSAASIDGRAGSLALRRLEWRQSRGRDAPRINPIEAGTSWADAVSWRLHRMFEMRHDADAATRYREQVVERIPKSLDAEQARQVETLLRELPRLGYPSVLEALQRGYDPDGQHDPALRAGLPPDDIAVRKVALSFQHRMHPDISAFPRGAFYGDGNLLQDPPGQAEKRKWSYHNRRSVWINVPPHNGPGNLHPGEVKACMAELDRFRHWAACNPKMDGKWSVCMLTFYRGQEKQLRLALRRALGGNGYARFSDEHIEVTLGTVDRFQGREADLVILSFVRPGWRPGFLDSPNRLNVALTRARYGLVIVGDQNSMQRSRVPMLKRLAEDTPRHAAFDLEARQ